MTFSHLNLTALLISFLLAFRHETATGTFYRRQHHPTGMANLDHYYFTIDPHEPNPTGGHAVKKIKKGARCPLQPKARTPEHEKQAANTCDVGLRANNGTVLVRCCGQRYVDVLSDRRNCGMCGMRCSRGMSCIQGSCTAGARSV